MTCPKCKKELNHFSGVEYIPEYFYCPDCMDYAYNEDGERIALLVPFGLVEFGEAASQWARDNNWREPE